MCKIKICGLTDPKNIIDVIQLNPDMVGFIFYKNSLRSVLNKNLIDVIQQIPSHIKKVGVFVDLEMMEVKKLIMLYQFDMIQLYHNDLEPFQELRKKVKLIKVVRIGNGEQIKQTEKYVHLTDYFLFDTLGELYGGNGIKFNWQILNEYKGSIPFILSGGIGPEDVANLRELNSPTFFGIDINSKFEIAHGMKDTKKIKNFKNELYHGYNTITK